MIKRNIPRNTQPQYPAQINRASTFGNRNWACVNIPGIALFGSANPTASLLTNTSNSVGIAGRSLNQAGSAANSGLSYGSNTGLQLNTSSGLIVFRNVSGTNPLFTTSFNTPASQGGFFVDLNAGAARLLKADVAVIVQSTNVAIAGQLCAIAWSYNSSTGRARIAFNGILTSAVSTQTFAHSGCNNLGYYTDNAGNTTPGSLALFALSPDECFSDQALINASIPSNSWGALFAPQQRNIYVSVASGAVTAALTGQSISVAQGSLTAAVTAPLTGQSLSLAQGSVTAASGGVSVALTGQSLSIAQGSISAAVVGALSGQSLSLAQGTLTASVGGVFAALTGQSLSLAQGTLSAVVSNALTGQSLSLDQGSVSVAGLVTTATTLVITKMTGTFAAGAIKVGATTVGTCTGAQSINGASTALLRAQYTNLAADVYRALITAVPGSGSILGIWMFNDVKYAFRNAADGLSAAMYKSTSSGWSLVALGRELSYTSGGGAYSPAVGNTITGNTSGATAVITAITVQTGTLASDTAVGRIIFASQTGTFQTETLNIGANLNVANISGNSTAITFAVPGGRFEFVNYNFGSGSKMYGGDGKNRGFEYNGTTFVPISTSMAADTPSFVKCHKNHLFYTFAGSLQHSGIGTPYTWTIVSGAAELAMGDTITGMQLQAGTTDSATMTVFTRNNIKTLYGSDASGADAWRLSSYKEEAGAYQYTNQQVGGTYMLDDRGITSLVTGQNFGNFEDATLTKKIQSWINGRRSMSIASCIARDKNQYRLFFTDGSALFVTIDNGNPIGMMPILLSNPVTCICSLENSSGNEEIYFGSTDGYVYQMDIGTSMDGGNIESYINLAFNHLKSPRILKSFKTAVLEVSGEGYGELSLGYDLSYISTEVVQPPTQATTLSLNSISYDSGATYDSGAVYDGVNLTPSVFHLGGDGENISLKILVSSDYGNPMRFSGALVDFIVRRRLR